MLRTIGMACLTLWAATLAACDDDDPVDSGTPDAGAQADAGRDAGEPDLRQIDRSALTDVGVTGALDYGKAEHWVCRPDIEPNECHRDLDATEIKPDNSLEIVRHERASNPEFDCFYVYPTVYLNAGPHLVDFSDSGVKLVADPLLSQAARFTSLCRMYVPLYRQVGLSGVALTPGADIALPLQDVRDAFAHYLEHDNQGRNFVLLGHSQGTFLMTSLIQRDVDPEPAVRSKLISAILLGGEPYTPPDALVGGVFENIPLCSAPDETGCFVGYVSYAAEAPPPAHAVFGKVTQSPLANEPADLNGKVACADPVELSGSSGRFAGSYFPVELNNTTLGAPVRPPGVTTPFVLYRNLLRGECKYVDGRSWFEIHVDRPANDVREIPPYRNPTLEAVGFGLHVVDFNIPLEDLLNLVKRQAAAH